MKQVIQEQAEDLTNPPMSVAEVVASLETQVPRSARKLKQLLDLT